LSGDELCLTLPPELAERLDEVVELLGFRSRERFAEAAIRRLLDRYVILAGRFLEGE
jgi:metal-responsive CopG/Arc/MetJ family transcriptional regulator